MIEIYSEIGGTLVQGRWLVSATQSQLLCCWELGSILVAIPVVSDSHMRLLHAITHKSWVDWDCHCPGAHHGLSAGGLLTLQFLQRFILRTVEFKSLPLESILDFIDFVFFGLVDFVLGALKSCLLLFLHLLYLLCVLLRVQLLHEHVVGGLHFSRSLVLQLCHLLHHLVDLNLFTTKPIMVYSSSSRCALTSCSCCNCWILFSWSSKTCLIDWWYYSSSISSCRSSKSSSKKSGAAQKSSHERKHIDNDPIKFYLFVLPNRILKPK